MNHESLDRKSSLEIKTQKITTPYILMDKHTSEKIVDNTDIVGPWKMSWLETPQNSIERRKIPWPEPNIFELATWNKRVVMFPVRNIWPEPVNIGKTFVRN